MNSVEEQVKLVSKILKGEIGKEGTEKELERISAEYGEDSFNSYTVKRKSRPWGENDLRELEILSASGAASKEFYLYMAEVSEAVYAEKAKKKRIIMGVVIAVVIVLIVAIAFCCGRQEGTKQISASANIQININENENI